jgi:hypothetical protein
LLKLRQSSIFPFFLLRVANISPNITRHFLRGLEEMDKIVYFPRLLIFEINATAASLARISNLLSGKVAGLSHIERYSPTSGECDGC